MCRSAMASVRSPALRTLLRANKLAPFRAPQRRWAQVHDVRFLATHRDPNHVLEKYKEKLHRKAKEEGLDSIESLKEAYKDKIENVRRESLDSITSDPTAVTAAEGLKQAERVMTSKSPASTPPSSSSTSSSSAASSHTPGIKPLSSYVDVDKFRTLPKKEIEALWRLRHAGNPNSICACIPLDTYRRIAAAARQHPQFILPLPRQQTPSEAEKTANKDASDAAVSGADIHFLQWGFHPPASSPSSTTAPTATANTHTSTIVFTHLAAYKLHGSYAEPHTTVTHHLDLADDTGLVLLLGQVLPDRGVSPAEASWLVSCVQRFYDWGSSSSGSGEAGGRKGELLRMFTRGDVEGFRVEELMEEAERI
ncbi:hypothetical protein VTN02DRAFT_4350 [Thermoascus thermophilus]